ncbi:MAG: endonuclease/exonuclease/phosphatase family protein [Planctomycetota bacterium]
MRNSLLFAAVIVLAISNRSFAEPMRILSWNIESGGSDPAIIVDQLRELGRYDAYCLQEVDGPEIGRITGGIREAFGKGYRYLASHTGRSDRLLIAYDAERFLLLEARELFHFQESSLNTWRHRSPLVLLLRDRASGEEFFLMTVHLARGDARFRQEQANGLREWVSSVERPVIATGDFNFDYDFANQRGNKAWEHFTSRGSRWKWPRPEPLIDTNWSDRDSDGRDNYPDSMLDFAFVAGFDNRTIQSRVIVRDGDFPDSDATSDHRPVATIVD